MGGGCCCEVWLCVVGFLWLVLFWMCLFRIVILVVSCIRLLRCGWVLMVVIGFVCLLVFCGCCVLFIVCMLVILVMWFRLMLIIVFM